MISRAVVHWIPLELALENPSFKKTNQANLACYKGPTPCIDLVGESQNLDPAGRVPASL